MVLIPVLTAGMLFVLFRWGTNKQTQTAWIAVSYAIKFSTVVGGVFFLLCIYKGLVEDVKPLFWVFFLPQYTIIVTSLLFLMAWGISSITILYANQKNNIVRGQTIPAIAGSIFSFYISFTYLSNLAITAKLMDATISPEYIEQKYSEYKDKNNAMPLLAIANNPNTPPNILEHLVDNKRPMYFKNYDSPLVSNYFGLNGSILGFVAQNPSTQAKVLEILASYNDPWILQYASEFENFPIKSDVYIKAASYRIRRNVKGNPNTPAKTIEKLSDIR